MKTIYALSTLAGKSGVAVFRISGGEAERLFADLTLGKVNKKYRQALYAKIYCPFSREVIDNSLIMLFKGPNSFTGEDTLEIYTHGSVAVINKLHEVFINLSYLSAAEPGEFSKRSFLNGKMDLTQAEGLASLIDAETENQRKVALLQAEGALSSIYKEWRASIIEIMASIEALIDFPAEDLPHSILQEAEEKIKTLHFNIKNHLKTADRSDAISNGINIVIAGSPNAGKSTLINQIAKSDIAIVSDISGTTRDIVTKRMDIGGYAVTFSDTAGIRDSDDTIEKFGIERSFKAVKAAEMVLFLIDGENFDKGEQTELINIIKKNNNKVQVVLNKVDALKASDKIFSNDEIAISAKTGYNVDVLLDKIHGCIVKSFPMINEPIISGVRVRENLKYVLNSLEQIDFDFPLEIGCEHLRSAAEMLAKVVGDIKLDDILDQVFGSFCIGK